MAKTRKSRRARKQIIEQQIVSTPELPTQAPEIQISVSRKSDLDFGQAYYYVYTELRNVLIIATVLFAVTFGLGYFI